MLIPTLRAMMMYFLALLMMRWVGKKQLGELGPSELVTTIFISSLAVAPIESPDVPFLPMLLPMLVVGCLEILISGLCFCRPRLAALLSGQPRVIIRNGKVEQKTMRDLRLSMADLMAALRGKDIFELSDVAFAMIETNGAMSVYRKFEVSAPTNQAMQLKKPCAEQPSLPLVADGIYIERNLQLLGVSRDWVAQKCREYGAEVSEVLVLLCNDAFETLLVRREEMV